MDVEDQATKAKFRSKKVAKKALAEAERNVKIKTMDAQVGAYKIKSDVEGQAAKVKGQSKKRAIKACDDSITFLQKKKGEIKAFFGND